MSCENKVLVIGSGGREHAICWKLSQSPKVKKIYALPGSYGIQKMDKCENLKNMDVNNFSGIGTWCKSNNIDLVVVGPEDPLANGFVDVLENFGIPCFGPSKQGALIESDKKWAKEFMVRHKIPTARFESFTDKEEAKKFINNAPYKALVVKASGLAAGKGVIVANNSSEACEAVEEILGQKKFGKAGEMVVVEELLTGEEISVLAFVDSKTVIDMLPAQDHKRLRDNDQGPNTGGMGAYCPCPIISKSELEIVKSKVLQRAVDGLRSENIQYCGVLYAGVMLTPDGPKVLEFNCRFGDPETQVILPLLENDLFDVMSACCAGKLSILKELNWKKNLAAVGVVMASAGYPETSTKGCVISGIPDDSDSQIVFHSAIALNKEEHLVTNGGRVLIAVVLRNDLKAAAEEATKVCEKIKFSGKSAQFRSDIARKAFKLKPLSYKDSGVDIDAGDDFVRIIKPLSMGTSRPGVLGGLGGFGGLFRLNELPYKNYVLSEATNSVGSKIKLALDAKMYENIGLDLFAMCANDVLEAGAEPIAFLDYIACGKLQVHVAAQIVKGISEGCRKANCALLGGETAEMPSIYEKGLYDIAGYCVGILEDGNDLPNFQRFTPGDSIVAIASSGLHCGGFEVVYKELQKMEVSWDSLSKFGDKERTFGQQITEPTRIYVKDILPLLKTKSVKAIAHITSGFKKGLEKLSSPNFELNVDLSCVEIPEVFAWLSSKFGLLGDDLLENFNCGIGLVMIISKDNKDWMNITGSMLIGELKKSDGISSVKVSNFNVALNRVLDNSKLGNTCSFNKVEIQKDNKFNLPNEIKNRPESFVSQGGRRLTRISKNYNDPVIVLGTDGCGTKIKIAQETMTHSTVGVDLVAMCVNDILCNGAEPLTFSSYYAGGHLEEKTVNNVMKGVIDGVEQAGCCLIGLHTAQLPSLYKPTVYDLAGFSMGIVENSCLLPKSNLILEGDSLLGIPSSGVHSNGLSLVHAVMKEAGVSVLDQVPFSRKTFAEELLTPTKIYVKAIASLLSKGIIKALAHITGGGLIENIPRILPKDMGVRIDARSFAIPPVFAWIADKGRVTDFEMQRTFNCGLGMILIVDSFHEAAVLEHLRFDHRAEKVGSVTKLSADTPQVKVEHFEECLFRVQRQLKCPLKRVAVLISGSGTNLQALIDATRDSARGLFSDIVLVISNKDNIYGLQRAADAHIPSVVISHKLFKEREDFDEAMLQQLEMHNVDIVCLAGFMRVLTNKFVRKWKGRLINIHPSLLPKHPGLHVQKKAIDAGDKESGCTVHFVDEGVDTGGIIVQEKVPILSEDTPETLAKRIQKAEHYAFPLALRLVSSGAVKLDERGNVCRFS